MPAVLSAANEVAVAAFLDGHLNFGGIPRVIGEVMNSWVSYGGEPELEAMLDADARAREMTHSLIFGASRRLGVRS
jgi:1-deoxy-D-xylulose-5-phosphate reductoisomerase